MHTPARIVFMGGPDKPGHDGVREVKTHLPGSHSGG